MHSDTFGSTFGSRRGGIHPGGTHSKNSRRWRVVVISARPLWASKRWYKLVVAQNIKQNAPHVAVDTVDVGLVRGPRAILTVDDNAEAQVQLDVPALP